MNLKIAIIGADGQLGTDLVKVIPKENRIPLTIKEIDVADILSVKKALTKSKPDIIINTAAYNRVDESEDQDLEAYKVNAHGAKNVAIVSREIDAITVHISTDYVFSGDKGSPYKEEDIPDPRTSYGISKLAGEQFVKYLNPKHYIVRTCGLYGVAGCMGKGGGNFVESMLNLAKKGQPVKVVADEFVGPTYTLDLAGKILELIGTGKFGLYHITNGGSCSWLEFASAIFEFSGIDIKVEKITASEYKSKAHRPEYSVLDNANLKKIGLASMRPWRDALKAYLLEKGSLKA
jgi:dTDP-4-dehydrorhamnose reductase